MAAEQFTACCRSLLDAAAATRDPDAWDGVDWLPEALDALEAGACRIVVVGAHSSGKSTLINALARAPNLLPEHVLPTTATAATIRCGKRPGAKVSFTASRTIGPWRAMSPSAEATTLAAVLLCLKSPSIQVQNVVAFKGSPSGPGQSVAVPELEDRHRRVVAGDASAGPTPWQWLRIQFGPMKSRRLGLSGPRSSAELHKWLSDDGLALAVAEVAIALPSVEPAAAILVDTPGLDAPSLQHCDATRRVLRSADALILVLNAKHAQIHADDLRCLRAVHEWLDDRARPVLHVATWADEGAARLRDEVLDEDGEEISARDSASRLRASIGDALDREYHELRKALAARAGGASTRMSADCPFVLDSTRFDDDDLDANRLRAAIADTVKTVADRRARLRNLVPATIQLAAQLERDARKELSTHQLKTLKAKASRLCSDLAELAALESELSGGLKEEFATELRNECAKEEKALTNSLDVQLNNRKDADELGAKWSRCAEAIVKRMNDLLRRRLDSLEARLKCVLEDPPAWKAINEGPVVTPPNVDEVARHLKGVGFFIGFKAGPRSKAQASARRWVAREMTVLHGSILARATMLLKHRRAQVDEQLQERTESLTAELASVTGATAEVEVRAAELVRSLEVIRAARTELTDLRESLD